MTERPRPRRLSARARSASGCSSRASRTTRSSCSIRAARHRPGTSARSASRDTAPTRSSGNILDASTPTRTYAPASASWSSRSPSRDGRFEDEGWRVRKDGASLLGQRRHHGAARRDGRARRLREGHARPDRATTCRGGAPPVGTARTRSRSYAGRPLRGARRHVLPRGGRPRGDR